MIVRIVCLSVLFASVVSPLQAGESADPYAKRIAKASAEGLKTAKRIQLPTGVHAELWAAEPLLANPVAFCFDEKGRIFVVETFRLHAGVTDNRSNMKWLDDELAARTVADRIAMYKKYGVYDKYGKDQDRIRLLQSSTGSGKPDAASIFADGFNRPEDGLASGVLAWRGNVFFTNIPDLWLLKDTKNTGRADLKKALHTGYGVHVAFIGHDSHGLKMGPDGRLYFSIGDRGLHVETEGRVLSQPDCGAVLRCNPDGSELELVHVGLRNPQELAFDKFGNLFTVDNNADGGDQARLVHLVEGGDSGWRIGYQYLPGLGMWNLEKTWQPDNPSRPAAYLPPLINFTNGPSGLTYHPGVAQLPEKYKDHFFVCDFRGGSGGSGVHAFTVKPKGATFALEQRSKFAWQVLATDCDFGPDGGFYILDWVEGWGLTGKGRIYRVADNDHEANPAVLETRKLIGEGMASRSTGERIALLGHQDMRVRLEAQYALAESKASKELEHVAFGAANQLARLHAIWGLGQIGRRDPSAAAGLVKLLNDPDPEVKANAAKVLGEARVASARDALVAAVRDMSPRVKFHAAIALGRVGKAGDVPVIAELLRGNADADPYLRHAGVVALAGINDMPALLKAGKDASSAVRLGVVLALRKLGRPEAARFLNDADPRVILEAARAIHDEPINAALPELAKILDRPLPDPKALPAGQFEALLRRGMAAHYRLGGVAGAQALVNLASRPEAPESVRLEAIKLLQKWGKPSGRDVIVGVWRPIAERPNKDAAEAVRAALPRLMTAGDKVRAESAKLAAQHGIAEIGPVLRSLVADGSQPASLRVESLRALEMLKDAKLQEAAEKAITDADGRLRHQARRILLAKTSPAKAAAQLSEVLDKGTLPEKQGAFELLGNLKTAEADALLASWLGRLIKNETPAEVQLDVIEAAQARKSQPVISKLLPEYKAMKAGKGPMVEYREALEGGDPEAGRELFHHKTELSCVRCHKLNGMGGEVGPDLTALSKRVKRDYLLESLVDPNKQIAKGYETVVLVLTNGLVKSGILKGETKEEVRLMTAEGQLVVIPASQIEERSRGPSAMPSDLIQKMSRRELRDLVAFLAGL